MPREPFSYPDPIAEPGFPYQTRGGTGGRGGESPLIVGRIELAPRWPEGTTPDRDLVSSAPDREQHEVRYNLRAVLHALHRIEEKLTNMSQQMTDLAAEVGNDVTAMQAATTAMQNCITQFQAFEAQLAAAIASNDPTQ